MLTPQIQACIISVLQKGGTFGAAAAHAGISVDTLHRWRRMGLQQKRGKLRAFADACDSASDKGIALAVEAFWRSFTEPTVETHERELSGGGIERKTVVRPPSADAALKFLERRAIRNPSWNPALRVAMGGDVEGVPLQVSGGLSVSHVPFDSLLSKASTAELQALADFREALESRMEAPGDGGACLSFERPPVLIEGRVLKGGEDGG